MSSDIDPTPSSTPSSSEGGAEAPAGPSAGSSAGSTGGTKGSPAFDADGDGLPDGAWVNDQRKQANAMGAGLQFGAVICIFALLGNWLDGKFETKPWLLVAGVLIGFVGGTISLLKKFK